MSERKEFVAPFQQMKNIHEQPIDEYHSGFNVKIDDDLVVRFDVEKGKIQPGFVISCWIKTNRKWYITIPCIRNAINSKNLSEISKEEVKQLGKNWKSRTEKQSFTGTHYQSQEKEPLRLPARAGKTPSDRVAGIRERNLTRPPEDLAQKSPHQRAMEMRIQANDQYVKGTISRETWMQKMREANKIEAPSRDEVLTTMNQRALDQGFPTDENKRYNGWSNWDTWETMLILDNTESTQKWCRAWSDNFNRKIKAGTFDPEKAEKVVTTYLVPTARGSKKWRDSDLATDPEIDPKKINKAEIVKHIIEYND